MLTVIDENIIKYCWSHCFQTKEDKINRILQKAFQICQNDKHLIIHGIDFVDEKIYYSEKQYTSDEKISFFDYFAISNLTETEEDQDLFIEI